MGGALRGPLSVGPGPGIDAVAIPVDSAVFVGLSTLFGVFPAEVAWSISWVNVVLKGLITLLSIPWIYWVRPEPLFVSP
jgi:hypothetical protein